MLRRPASNPFFRYAALLGLAVALGVGAWSAIRRSERRRDSPPPAARRAAPQADALNAIRLLPPVDSSAIEAASLPEMTVDAAVVRATAVAPTGQGVSFPSANAAPPAPRVAQLLPPVMGIEPPPPAEIEPASATAVAAIGEPIGTAVAQAPTFALPPPFVAAPPEQVAPGRVAPPSGSPPLVADPPAIEPVAPFQLGLFTQYGTITPADVRNMALMNNKEIAVLGHVPEVNEPLVAVELAAFDPVFNIALNGGRYNRQTSSQIQALGVDVPVLKTQFWQPSNGLNQVYFEKLFVTGGKVEAGLGQTYYNYNPAGDFVTVNPAYQASMNILVEQPLFRGRGPAATTAPMQIAQANYQQSTHVFRATVNQILRDAELAYWETYAAFQDFEVRDLAYKQSLQTLERERGRLDLGEGSVPDVAQAEEQTAAFHIARADAENRLIAAQRNLRRLLGLPPDDPRPIIPAAPPSDAPLELDWESAAADVANRPEFAAQAAAVQAVEIEMARRRNGLMPDLSVQGIYSVTGLDQQFGDAWGTTGQFGHNSWTAGIVYKQPLGRRSDRALADRAAAALALESSRLVQVEHEIRHQIDAAMQNVAAAQRMLALHRRRREAAAVQLEARRELYLENRADLRDQLEAEARYASALFDEAVARVNYQRSLTELRFARGEIGEGEVVYAD